ncbi:TolB family protein [Pararhodonellum marinum]|uniref:TolB family protein n=1 Tax=Pararhodonellum marinum TaxID=2755358 RepID=UPI00188F2201|nr:PD40 domain-containing protein [Pararhodonellum marinum]
MKRLYIYLLLILLTSPFAFSQSGNERIFYSSLRPQGWDIWIADNQTEKIDQLTNHDALEYNPVISPDGKWIVFTSERLGNPKIFIKSLEEKNETRLLIDHESSMQDQAVISPDRNWIVFTSTHEGQSDIYRLPFQPFETLNVDDAINLTHHQGGDFRPSFSPDGSQIIFSSDRNHPIKAHPIFVFAMRRTADIYSMTIDGENLKRLTTNDHWDGSPCYSNDGEKIFFYSGPRDSYRIYSMDTEGGNQAAISPEGINAISPSILNDSTLVFTTVQNRAFRLMSLNLKTNQVDSMFNSTSNFLGAKANKNGLITFYGGQAPSEMAYNLGGFEGDLLVKGSPYTIDLNTNTVDLYAVRRAFAAPPNPTDHTLIFDHTDVRGLSDAMTNWAYSLLAIILIYVIFVGTGNRNLHTAKGKLSAILFFNVMAVSILALLAFVLYYFFIDQLAPINTIRVYLGVVALFLVLCIGFTHKNRTRILFEQLRNIFVFNLASTLFIIIVLPLLIQIPIRFYEVDYNTNEVTSIYPFTKPSNYNPLNGMVIDTKFNPSGSDLLYSVGNFRGGPSNQGDVFSLNLSSLETTKLTLSDFNDGFGDVTTDQSKIVFRSGRSGFFDIYLQEGGTIQNFTSDEHRDNFPIISPQGDKIAFCSDRLGTDIEGKVKTMDLFLSFLHEDGTWSKPKRMTDDVGQDAHPHFSPDGDWIIYASEEGGINDEEPLVQSVIFGPQIYGEIFAIHIDSDKKIRLTHNKWEDGAPLWAKGIGKD